MNERAASRTVRIAVHGAALVALAAVFAAYFDPDLLVDLASRVWACF